jgi:hypothetical protein
MPLPGIFIGNNRFSPIKKECFEKLSQNFSFWESNRKIRGFARLNA